MALASLAIESAAEAGSQVIPQIDKFQENGYTKEEMKASTCFTANGCMRGGCHVVAKEVVFHCDQNLGTQLRSATWVTWVTWVTCFRVNKSWITWAWTSD